MDTPDGADLSLDDATGLLTGEFGKQFGGSAMANIFTLLLVGLFMGLKKLCNRKSKCKSHIHCPCLDVDIVDQTGNTIRTVPENVDDSGPVAV
jgi:hypothetical protein